MVQISNFQDAILAKTIIFTAEVRFYMNSYSLLFASFGSEKNKNGEIAEKRQLKDFIYLKMGFMQ
jgi:hypothetical protein